MSDGPEARYSPVYSFGETDLAARRLELVSRVFDPASEGFVSEALPGRPRLALDLGCGPGFTTRLLSRVARPERVFGVDRSEDFLRKARASSRPPEQYLSADVTQGLPDLGDERPDLIYARMLASHLPLPERAISQWISELASGGVMLVEEVESIETEVDAFERYLEIVAGMLAHYGNELYVGPRLAAVRWGDGVSARTNRTAEVRPAASEAAAMFSMNLSGWRRDPYVESRYSRREIDALAAGLQGHEDRPDTGAIVWRIRQIALAHGPARD